MAKKKKKKVEKKVDKKVVEKKVVEIKKSKNIFMPILLIVLTALMTASVFMYIIMPREEKEIYIMPDKNKVSYDGTGFLTKVYPIFNDIIFVGDSYTQFLASTVGFDINAYCEAGYRLSELKEAATLASKTDTKYASVFVGPNDMRYKTSIKDFKKDLKGIFDILKDRRKIVIMTSYLKSEYTEKMMDEYKDAIPVEMYDDAIKEVCKEENVYYFDAKDINDFKNDRMYLGHDDYDMLHFSKDFYIKYVNKLYGFLYDNYENN